jgi:hypothetical protein
MMRGDRQGTTAVRRTRARKRAEAVRGGFVTSRGLRDRLGITDAQFRSLTYRSVIAADDHNSAGYAIYSPKTVERLMSLQANGSLFPPVSASTTGDGHALPYSAADGVRVFELLEQGRTIKEIILETRIHPLVVKRIGGDYDDISGTISLPKTVVDKINALDQLPGSFPLRDADGVLEVIELCAQGRACRKCKAPETVDLCQDCLIIEQRRARQRMRTNDPEFGQASPRQPRVAEFDERDRVVEPPEKP